MDDKLNMGFINSLAQPLYLRLYGDKDVRWPLESIDVETGCLRFDVCGLLQVGHIGDVAEFIDSDGIHHDSETFYSDYIHEPVSSPTPTEEETQR